MELLTNLPVAAGLIMMAVIFFYPKKNTQWTLTFPDKKQFIFYLQEKLRQIEYHQAEYRATDDQVHLQMATDYMQEYSELLAAAQNALLQNNARIIEKPVNMGVLILDDAQVQEGLLELNNMERAIVKHN